MSPDEIREALLSRALRLFREEGYEATSISRLTRESGVAKGTFFNHFPTKEHVLADFAARAWDDAVEETRQEDHRGTDAIIHVLDGFARRLEAHDGLASVLADRLSSLPRPHRGPDDPPGDDESLLAHWKEWIHSRIAESLPISVPLQPVEHADLAALLASALATSLLEATSASGAREPAPVSLGRRAVFLLRSAGFVAPDPPTARR